MNESEAEPNDSDSESNEGTEWYNEVLVKQGKKVSLDVAWCCICFALLYSSQQRKKPSIYDL